MSQQEIQQQMDDMRSFDEPMPQVGIFWYDHHWDLGHGWSGDF